jgi:hypothetical protein
MTEILSITKALIELVFIRTPLGLAFVVTMAIPIHRLRKK